ncbi:hypothetical protein IFM89_012661 [Coptis chinensis]|uniref:snRNA-activating protein complex subunit n=1 Tax=Coptis chinensis TaxID=261450 RepID=A0A835H5P1_9MAGN|nr:hypothetical protein IFM89_012661 [Coptis chinensis]
MEDGAVQYQVPRGGPIYHPDLVSPLTRTSEFETSVVIELQNLFSQLQTKDEDISVNELKILSEEDLVEIASKDALLLQIDTTTVEEKRKNKGTKRGRQFDRDTRAAELENPSFVGKIEEVAKIKEKQDEDRVAVKLHSNEVSVPLVENVGKMTSSSTKIRKLSNVSEHIPIPYPQVILCVQVYKMSKIWVKTQEFLVLGSQMLSELRDQIYCLTDHLMQKAGEHDPSGYFLIEDVFCNDKRDPSAIDYSDPIFEWLRKSKDEACEKWECILSGELQQKQRALLGHATTPHLPQFKAVDMHKIRFCDLWFRVGAGYLYCHQGDCKHILVIRDMRLIHPEDVQNRAAYPVLTFQHKNRFRKCSVCKVYRASKVTVDDKWAQENPCYFCDNCYYLLHYTEDGSLLYHEFTVYDYHHE